jgi:hypothetical protein
MKYFVEPYGNNSSKNRVTPKNLIVEGQQKMSNQGTKVEDQIVCLN